MPGVDKEATDIWMFGKPRPDLTIEDTMEEFKRRNELLQEHADNRIAKLVPQVLEMARKAKEDRDAVEKG